MSASDRILPLNLGWYLLIALAVRFPGVMFSRGYEFVDAQFMYVDPAYGLAFGADWWENFVIQRGMKSWVYPEILASIFRFSDTIGISGSEVMMVFTRFVHAVISMIPVAAFWCFLRERARGKGDLMLLLVFACNPIFVYSSIQPTAITFAVGMSLTAIFTSQCKGIAMPIIGGLALGLAFACRFQDALFGPVIVVGGLIQKRNRAMMWFCIGCTLGVVGQGVVDLVSYGSVFHSPIAYCLFNLSDEAKSFGQQSLFLYLEIVAVLLICIPPFIGSTINAVRFGVSRFPILFACALMHIGVHNLIGRKALRFVLPSLVLMLTVFVAGHVAQGRPRKAMERWHLHVFLVLQFVALAIVSVSYCHRGPIEAAVALSQNREFGSHLVVVDGAEESLGGYFYLRRKNLTVEIVARAELREKLACLELPSPVFLMVCNEPLDSSLVDSDWLVEDLGGYQSWPRASRRSSRYLYALRSRDQSNQVGH